MSTGMTSPFRILCYGDSLTWGSVPYSPIRPLPAKRWPHVMAKDLASEKPSRPIELIEEGCGGRTTTVEDPLTPHRNGAAYLPACLHSHRPLDAVIVMLGTNDLKSHLQRSPMDIANSIVELSRMILGYPQSAVPESQDYPKLLVVSPPPVRMHDAVDKTHHFQKLFHGATEKSVLLHEAIKQSLSAANLGANLCGVFDAGSVCHVGADGVHLDVDDSVRLGHALASEVSRTMFFD